MKILHFAFDEKVIPLTHSLYNEAFPEKNTWKIYLPEKKSLKFTKDLDSINVIHDDYFISKELEENLKNYDCIVIHYLFHIHKNVLKKASKHTLIVWHSWGGDYAHTIAPYTNKVVLRYSKFLEVFSKIFSFFDNDTSADFKLNRFKKILSSRFNDEDFLYGRIDVVSIQKELYPILLKALPELSAKQHYINSYTLENTFDIGSTRFSGENILLGNSAYASNNHIEAILLLKKLNLHNSKVVIPLSYGNTLYAKVITYLGKKLLGKNNIDAFMEFLPMATYYEKIESCGFVIMNHTRQQARGNINMALYKGCKVFLRKENPIYLQCKNLGIHIFSIENILESNDNFTHLSEEQIATNRNIITQYWQRSNAITSIKTLKDFVNEKKTK